MKAFRYIYAAILVLNIAFCLFLDISFWQKLFFLAWIAAPLVVNEYQLNKKSNEAAEQAAHSSNSVQDQILHNYRERI